MSIFPRGLEVAQRTAEEVDRSARSEGPNPARQIAARLLDEFIQDTPSAQRIPIACQSGCSHCCHLRVIATPAEILSLLEYLERNLSSDDMDAFRIRVAQKAELVRGMSPLEHAKTNIPCPALVENRCIGYSSRPIRCMGYHSTDEAACKRSYDFPTDLDIQIPKDLGREIGWQAAADGLEVGLGSAGYDATLSELVTALDEAIRDPDVRRRFQEGEVAFRSAIAGEFDIPS